VRWFFVSRLLRHLAEMSSASHETVRSAVA
jgi:hypothetical protein